MTLVARPSYLANRAVNLNDFVGGLGVAQPPRISLKDDRFTILDETGMVLAEPTLSLNVVIVGTNKNASRIFYGMDPTNPSMKKRYNPDDNAGPLCWSDNGVGPSKGCTEPQAPTCGACKWAGWGSAISQVTGKGIPACSGTKKIAVLVNGHEAMFLLVIPPDSTKIFQKYMLGELAKIPANPEEVITKLRWESKQLVFEVVDWVPENYLTGIIAPLIENDDMGSIVNRHDEARDPSEFSPHKDGLSRRTDGLPVAELTEPRLTTPLAQRQAAAVEAAQTPFPAPQAQIAATPTPRRGRPPGATNKPKEAPAFQQATETLNKVQFSAPQGFGFGMQAQPQAPDAGVQGMLDRAFSLPRRS